MSTESKWWKCSVCGEAVKGEAPPSGCPGCGVGTDKFEEIEPEISEYANDSQKTFLIVGGGPAGTMAASEIRKKIKWPLLRL